MRDPGEHQLAAAGAHQLALLADRPLHEEPGVVERVVVVGSGRVVQQRVGLLLLEARDCVMGDAAAGDRGGPQLDGPHPARLGQAGLAHRLPPGVVGLGGHREGSRSDDQIRRSAEALGEVPLRRVGPLSRRRKVGRIATRRAAVDPPYDGIDLRVGERAVVLELRDADRAVDVPRRHLPRRDAFPDGPGPGTSLLVRHQRHGRDGVGAVARLALGLEDGRDVPREGWRLRLRRRGGTGQPGKDGYRRQPGVQLRVVHGLSHPLRPRTPDVRLMEAPPGFEPGMEVLQTSALPLGDGAVEPEAWADRATENGAGNGIRTRDFDLGKVALYH